MVEYTSRSNSALDHMLVTPIGSTSIKCVGRAALTIRRQTVFYTTETLTVSQGDEVKGHISCAPNSRNNRDLDIRIEYEVDGAIAQSGNLEYKM